MAKVLPPVLELAKLLFGPPMLRASDMPIDRLLPLLYGHGFRQTADRPTLRVLDHNGNESIFGGIESYGNSVRSRLGNNRFGRLGKDFGNLRKKTGSKDNPKEKRLEVQERRIVER